MSNGTDQAAISILIDEPIGIWGGTRVGKSTYIEGVILAFHSLEIDWKIWAANPPAKLFTERDLPLLLQGIFPKASSISKIEEYEFRIQHDHELLRDHRKYNLKVVETAGIHIKNPSDEVAIRYFNELNKCKGGLLLMFDAEDLRQNTFASSETFAHLMILMNRLEASSCVNGVLDLDIAICLTKMDINPHWQNRNRPREYFKELIGEYSFNTLVNKCNLKRLKFFSISVVGRYTTPKGEEMPNIIIETDTSRLIDMKQWRPYNLLNPLFWLFEQQIRQQEMNKNMFFGQRWFNRILRLWSYRSRGRE
jgi:hypothetical protein